MMRHLDSAVMKNGFHPFNDLRVDHLCAKAEAHIADACKELCTRKLRISHLVTENCTGISW